MRGTRKPFGLSPIINLTQLSFALHVLPVQPRTECPRCFPFCYGDKCLSKLNHWCSRASPSLLSPIARVNWCPQFPQARQPFYERSPVYSCNMQNVLCSLSSESPPPTSLFPDICCLCIRKLTIYIHHVIGYLATKSVKSSKWKPDMDFIANAYFG